MYAYVHSYSLVGDTKLFSFYNYPICFFKLIPLQHETIGQLDVNNFTYIDQMFNFMFLEITANFGC